MTINGHDRMNDPVMSDEERFRVKPMVLAISGPPYHFNPMSTAVMHPCPWCVEIHPVTRHMRPIQRLTKCTVCKGLRAITIPGLWPGVLKLFEQTKEKEPENASL